MRELRPITEAEHAEYSRLVARMIMGSAPSPEQTESRRPVMEIERTLAMFEDGAIVGTAGAFSLPLSVPGGRLRAAGVTSVSVASTHRRRGILTEMMARQLADVRRRGEPLALLYAAEAPIYGRFGYGLASYSADLKIARHRAGFRRPVASGGVRLVDAATAAGLFDRLWEQSLPDRPGQVNRSPAWWRLLVEDRGRMSAPRGDLMLAVHEGAGGPDGCVAYRRHAEFGPSGWNAAVAVDMLAASGPDAYAALWRYVLDVDLMETVTAHNRPPDEPLRHLLADERALDLRIEDGIWLRLVDVEAALAGRTYGASSRSVTLAVEDRFCAWNQGTYRVGPEGAWRQPGEPDLELEVDALGACYLAGNSFSNLLRAGRLRERRPGAAAAADALFATPLEPWCGLHF